ncbi:hypothetical protein GO755_01210 [Spirosoma sp. HMF4905]|uniref:Signal transduction histidine kinase internal region domain-containing protein n=1 Tax=Spirosoma arboris TaxID=2682092 RepID=A0A7K1S476_9BACT|nr:histidine kinase [Spirosoma arboris]MVM28631.1 hypothetical protein [Spirosoma arboris]
MNVPLSALSFDALNDRWVRLIGIPVAVLPFVLLTIAAYGYNGRLVVLTIVWGLVSTTLLWHLLLWWVVKIRMEYPGRPNTGKRIWKTFGGYSLFTVVDQLFETRTLYLLDPSGRIPEPIFPDDYLLPIAMALFFVVVVGSYYEGSYNLRQYRQAVERAEAVKKNQLLSELARLKNQVNPHFLFNSLNSLSALISEDRRRASAFLDELASVYRYMLQASQRPLVPLTDELAFLDAYRYLLNERYGRTLCWQIEAKAAAYDLLLPPLTLQILVDNALRYNSLLQSAPLTITIRSLAGNRLEVSNLLQRKSVQVATQGGGLGQLAAQFSALGLPSLYIFDNGQTFSVTLPLSTQRSTEINVLAS